MHERISANLTAANERFALVVSRFNEFITSHLLAGALDALRRHGVADANLTEVWVPGAWELPLAAKTLAQSGRFDAVICLGCVIRGQTPHFEYVASEAAKGVAHASMETNVPIAFGVLTTDTLEQAVERAGGKSGNKGADAALTAIEMAGVMSALRGLKKK